MRGKIRITKAMRASWPDCAFFHFNDNEDQFPHGDLLRRDCLNKEAVKAVILKDRAENGKEKEEFLKMVKSKGGVAPGYEEDFEDYKEELFGEDNLVSEESFEPLPEICEKCAYRKPK